MGSALFTQSSLPSYKLINSRLNTSLYLGILILVSIGSNMLVLFQHTPECPSPSDRIRAVWFKQLFHLPHSYCTPTLHGVECLSLGVQWWVKQIRCLPWQGAWADPHHLFTAQNHSHWCCAPPSKSYLSFKDWIKICSFFWLFRPHLCTQQTFTDIFLLTSAAGDSIGKKTQFLSWVTCRPSREMAR